MRQLRYFAPRVLGGPMPELVENKLRLVAAAASRSRLSTDRTSLRDLASEIEWAKTTLATPDDYPARAQAAGRRSEEHTSELQSRQYLVCRLLLDKKENEIVVRSNVHTFDHQSRQYL